MNRLCKTSVVKSLTRTSLARFGGAPAPQQLEKFHPITLNQKNIYESLIKRLDYRQVGIQHSKIESNKNKVLKIDENEYIAEGEKAPEVDPITIYKSENVAGTHTGLRDFVLFNGAIFLAVLEDSRFAFIPFAAYIVYDLFKNHSVQVQKRMIKDLQLLPSQNELQISIPKNWRGFETKTYNIDDLEIVDTSTLEDKELGNEFWPINAELDPRIVLRSKSSDEKFVFDKNGEWDWNAIFEKKQEHQENQ